MLNSRSYDYCSVEKIEEARRVEPRGSMLCYGLEYQAPERRVSFRCLFPIMIIIGSATDGPECCDGLSVHRSAVARTEPRSRGRIPIRTMVA